MMWSPYKFRHIVKNLILISNSSDLCILIYIYIYRERERERERERDEMILFKKNVIIAHES